MAKWIEIDKGLVIRYDTVNLMQKRVNGFGEYFIRLTFANKDNPIDMAFGEDKKTRDRMYNKIKANLFGDGKEELIFSDEELVLLKNALDVMIDRCLENGEDDDIRIAYKKVRQRIEERGDIQ